MGLSNLGQGFLMAGIGTIIAIIGTVLYCLWLRHEPDKPEEYHKQSFEELHSRKKFSDREISNEPNDEL